VIESLAFKGTTGDSGEIDTSLTKKLQPGKAGYFGGETINESPGGRHFALGKNTTNNNPFTISATKVASE
jgi:hypothetical protein